MSDLKRALLVGRDVPKGREGESGLPPETPDPERESGTQVRDPGGGGGRDHNTSGKTLSSRYLTASDRARSCVQRRAALGSPGGTGTSAQN